MLEYFQERNNHKSSEFARLVDSCIICHAIHVFVQSFMLEVFYVITDKMLQEPKQLPQLQLANEHVLFISNAAAMYLFPLEGNDNDGEINEWLEWESSVLRPVLIGYVISKTDNHKKGLVNCLLKLDETLSSSSSTFIMVNINIRKDKQVFNDNYMFVGRTNSCRCDNMVFVVSLIQR